MMKLSNFRQNRWSFLKIAFGFLVAFQMAGFQDAEASRWGQWKKTDSSPTVNHGSFELSANRYSVREDAGRVNIVVKRVGGSSGTATVDIRTLAETAKTPTDYVGMSWTTLRFANGETQKTQSITIVDNKVVDGDKTFRVLIGNPTGGATLGSVTSATVTIVDDDKATSSTSTGSTTQNTGTSTGGTTNTSSSSTSGSTSTSTSTSSSTTTNPNLSYLPVFPGAMGHGTETRAGRGGQIIKVTNLNDSGAGSLRAAIDTSGARIIVFEVGGTINLSSDLNIRNPFVTIAGQTAPSPGINLRGAGVRITTNDVLLQHIRIRPGDGSSGPSASNRDCLQVLGPNARNVVIDHVSASWAVDENMSTWYALNNVTFSNNLIAEALHASIHPKGPHSMGLLIGEGARNVTLAGNLFAHNNDRNPRLKGDVSAVVLNNLFYNASAAYGNFASIGCTQGPNTVSLEGNVFLAGPNTKTGAAGIKVESAASSGTRVYFNDNRAPAISHYNTSYQVSSRPIWHQSLVARPSNEVESRVTSFAGARPADRDPVDARIISQVRNRTGKIINSQSEVGGWPNLSATRRTFNIPANPHVDSNGNGYTDIEEVLHQMAAQVEGR